jgi:hypothetical protein
MNKDKLLNKLVDFLDKMLSEEEQPNVVTSEVDLPIVKSANEEERLALFLVLEPQEDDGTTADLHGDWYDAEEVKKACHDYNVNCERIGIMHRELVSDNEVVVRESYIAPCDFVTEYGDTIKKGSWLMWLHFPSDDTWNKIKDGTYDSVSIDCVATGYNLV